MPEITYTLRDDYYLPNIALRDPPPELVEPLGRYGRMHRAYLKEHWPIHYARLLLTERLFPFLREIDETANERRRYGVSEEVILTELVYG